MNFLESRRNKLLIWAAFVIPTLVTLLVIAGLFWSRHSRRIVFRDLRQSDTQTVTVAFAPHHWRWRVAGRVDGSGTLIVEPVYSNTVNGRFSASGSGDYYATNASAIFIPHGNASGKITVSFWFEDWF